jgi:hypothetical protein
LAVLNTFIRTFDAIAAVVPTGTPEEIATAMTTSEYEDALYEFERLCT